MHGNLPSGSRTAIDPGDKAVVEKSSNDTSVADDENWFETAACVLLPIKPGTALHFTTGFDERSCQRYAAGAVKPPAYFLRRLLRSSQGRQWLAAVMDGCDEQWWLDHQRAQRIVAAEDAIDRT